MAVKLLILSLSVLGTCQETSTYYTTVDTALSSSADYASTTASNYAGPTTASSYGTMTSIALPTVPFTGQALIVGT